MKMTKIALLATSLALSAGTASAIGSTDRAEQLRRSAEMNMPLDGLTDWSRDQARTPVRMSAADARAAEFRANTDMMRPQTFGSPAAARGAPASEARSPDDRAAAEMIKRTDMMKPD